MRLLNLTVHNLGVFRGEHHFDLAPISKPDGTARHLSVISGQNGVGKSSLFGALALGLHGPLALGDRISRQSYNNYLLSRLHRYAGPNGPIVSDDAGIALSFQYVQSGRSFVVEVRRHWARNGAAITEDLIVSCDGERPDVDKADYQTWLSDLVPPGLMPLCFFDAERLDAFALTEGHLSDVLRRLLGLDLVARLQADLDRFTLGQGGGRAAMERLRTEVVRCQAKVDHIVAQLAEAQDRAAVFADQQVHLDEELKGQERQFAAEGGTYAARRNKLQAQLKEVESVIESAGGQLSEMCGELLPFALVPKLCESLGQRLAHERELRRDEIATTLWNERLAQLGTALEQDEMWQNLSLSAEQRRELAGRFLQTMHVLGASTAETEPILHHLAEREQEQLENWITQARQDVPQQVKILGKQLRHAQAERRRIEADLQRVPDDAVVAPLQEAINTTHEAVAAVAAQRAEIDKEIGSLLFQQVEARRQLAGADDQLRKAQVAEQQVDLAERSRLALRAYEDALTRQRLASLEETLVTTFNTICRKEHLLEKVRISADDWSMQLYNMDGHPVRADDFSAGERQLYALALLWAMRQVSGRQLPLAIDTPFARLDEIHRWRLLHDYIPAVSEQVLLFTTTAELEVGQLAEAEPQIARIYRLAFDPEREETIVTRQDQMYQYDSEDPVARVLDSTKELVYGA